MVCGGGGGCNCVGGSGKMDLVDVLVWCVLFEFSWFVMVVGYC